MSVYPIVVIMMPFHTQAISDLQEAHKQKRMQGEGIMLVTLDHPASSYLSPDQQQGVHVVDLHDNPWGW